MKRIFTIAFILVASACSTQSNSIEKNQSLCGASVSDLQIARTAALLLDIRSADEFAAGHLKGASNIPVEQLEKRLSEISLLKDYSIAVYCRSGKRAAKAKDILSTNGFNHVANVGGYEQLKGCMN